MAENETRDQLEARAKELGITDPQSLADEELRTEVEARENKTDGLSTSSSNSSSAANPEDNKPGSPQR